MVSCLSNYWLDNNAANCVNCDRNCQQCSSTTRCNVCNSGFYLTSGGTCSACLPNCFNCTNGLSCSLCANTSLYYNNTLGSCQGGTVNNCMIFSNSTACSVCANGYYLTSSKLCAIISTAIPYCRVYQSVNGNVVCVGCMNQYYQYMGVGSCRFGCSWLCSTCQGPHFGLCLTCNQNSYMNNLNCLPYYNINQGAGYQLYYTAANNPNFFKGELITSTDACLV